MAVCCSIVYCIVKEKRAESPESYVLFLIFGKNPCDSVDALYRVLLAHDYVVVSFSDFSYLLLMPVQRVKINPRSSSEDEATVYRTTFAFFRYIYIYTYIHSNKKKKEGKRLEAKGRLCFLLSLGLRSKKKKKNPSRVHESCVCSQH